MTNEHQTTNKMQYTTLTIDPKALDEALKAARKANLSVVTGENPNSNLDAGLRGRISQVWDDIENALRKGFQLGREKGAELLTSVKARLETLLLDAKEQASLVNQQLMVRIQAFQKDFMERAFAQFPGILQLNGKQYPLSKINFTQSISLSGSIQLSLTKVFELVAEGEIQLSVEYGNGV
jgi:hypothetical protein